MPDREKPSARGHWKRPAENAEPPFSGGSVGYEGKLLRGRCCAGDDQRRVREVEPMIKAPSSFLTRTGNNRRFRPAPGRARRFPVPEAGFHRDVTRLHGLAVGVEQPDAGLAINFLQGAHRPAA